MALTNIILISMIGRNTPAMPLHSGASTNRAGFFMPESYANLQVS